MTKKKVWRYTCGLCKKSGCSGGHIARHERHCTKNPERVCRMCARVGDTQAPLSELLISTYTVPAYGDDGANGIMHRKLDKLRIAANNCPACILATLRQLSSDPEDYIPQDPFSFKDEAKAWLEDYRESCITFRGAPVFDRKEWDKVRAARFLAVNP